MSSLGLNFSFRFCFLILGGVVFCDPLTIAAAGNVADPVFMFKIPANGFLDAAFKRLQRAPVQFALDFARVHGVAAVVAGAVFDKRNERAVGNGGIVRAQFVQQFANGPDNLEVLLFASPTDVIGFSDTAV